MSQVRVLHVAEAFGGGVFEQIRNLTARLRSHRVATAIAYGERAETPADCASMVAAEVELFPLPWRKRNLTSQLRAAWSLRRVYREWRPDVIHLHSSFAGLVGSLTAPRGVSIVYTPHGYSFTMQSYSKFTRAIFRTLERVVATRVDAIGAVSRSEGDLASSLAPSTRVVTIENGIPDLDRPVPRRKSRLSKRPAVLAMGRLAPQQRPAETAEILHGVADVADVAWIGDGSRPEDRRPLDQLGICVTGWITHEEAVARLSEADLYVHWAAWDGFPLSVLEAMAVDTVVIGSEIPPLREILPVFQRATTPAEAIATIRHLLQDAGEYERCLDAQESIRSRYSADRMAAGWAETYRGLLSPTASPLTSYSSATPSTRPMSRV